MTFSRLGKMVCRSCLVLLVVLAAFTLTACNPRDFRSNAAQVPQLIDWTLSDPKTFNLPLSNESPTVFDLIYESLLVENALTGELEALQAESWVVSEDKKRITFTLRPNLKWSDGQPLTAEDVLFTFQGIYLNPDIPTDTQDVLRIGQERRLPTVKKLDDRRIEFTTPEPFAPFLRNIGLTAILPKHALEAAVKTKGPDGNPKFFTTWGTNTDPRQIICNGPYMMESYATSQRVVFRRNPYYWRKDNQGNPQPYIERVVWQIVENQNTALLQFRSGSLDVSEPLRPEDFPLLKQQEKQGQFKVYIGGPRPITTFMAFNLNQGRRNGKPLVDPVKSRWFNTVAFRQAVAYAIDRDTMNTNIYRGLGSPINSIIMPQSPYYLSPQNGLKVYNYDIQKAKQLLQSAGFRYDNQGQLFDSEGNRVRFTLMTNAGNTVREAMISQIKQDLAKIGIQVDLDATNFNELIKRLDTSLTWDAYLLAMGNSRDPSSGLNVWLPDSSSHSFNLKPQKGPAIEGRVVAAWEAEIGRLYIAGSQELDEAKRKQIYNQVQQLAQENLPWIPLVNARVMAVARNRIQGIQYPELGGTLWNLYQLRIVD